MVDGILLFLIFIGSSSRAVVNHDGNDGIAPDLVVWSAGALPKRRRLVHAVRYLAMLPGPPAIRLGEWVAGLAVTIGAEDVALSGPTLLVFWLSGLLFLVLFIGQLGVLTLVLVVSLMLSCSFFMSFRQERERDSLWRRLILVIFDQGVPFQCRLFRLVQALIFGALVDLLVL